MNLKRREKYIFIVTVGLVVSVLVFNFVLDPIFKKWSILNNEITLNKTRLKKGMKLLGERNAIIKEYNSYASSIRNISKILNYIERLGNSLGIKTANISPRPMVQKEFYREYIIELQIEGEFADINKFISELIKSPLFVTVTKFDFRTVRDSKSLLKGTLILSKIII